MLPFGWPLFFALLLTWALISLTFIDFDTMLLPDQITLPLLWLGLLININGTFVGLTDAVLGAAFGYLSLWSIYWIFKLLTGKEGMGGGDIKLLAMIGAFLGWKAVVFTIFAGSATGTLVGAIVVLGKGGGRKLAVPFGPFLSLGALLFIFFGPQFIDWYLGLMM